MPFYFEEEEQLWKCPKHPSKHRRTGICPTCLRNRLLSLCPQCSNVRPCACYTPATTKTTSVANLSNLIDTEPSFRRSRSLAVPFLRSSSRFAGDSVNSPTMASFWSIFKREKVGGGGEERENGEIERRGRMMKSRSVAVSVKSDLGSGDVREAKRKGRKWHFPSPMRVFKQPSPLYRG